MVRRGRTAAVTSSDSTQRRLDEAFGEHDEAQAESDYRELRESRSSHAPLPYEERVAAWIREREEALRRRDAPSPESAPPAVPTSPPLEVPAASSEASKRAVAGSTGSDKT